MKMVLMLMLMLMLTLLRDERSPTSGSTHSMLIYSNHDRGNVLEVAAGTGRNTEYYSVYPKDPVDSVTLVDHSPSMLEQAKAKEMVAKAKHALARPFPSFNYQVMDAHQLRFKDEEFDTVVDTFGLCSFEASSLSLYTSLIDRQQSPLIINCHHLPSNISHLSSTIIIIIIIISIASSIIDLISSSSISYRSHLVITINHQSSSSLIFFICTNLSCQR